MSLLLLYTPCPSFHCLWFTIWTFVVCSFVSFYIIIINCCSY